MDRPTIYVFVNKGLQMSAGKMGAQIGHAVAQTVVDISQDARQEWKKAMHRTIIVMEARDEHHIANIKNYLEERGIPGRVVIDEGANEIDGHTITAYATTVVDKGDADNVKALSTFKLYRDKFSIMVVQDND